MSYLNFDKTLLVNLERSLSKEMIRTNRAGTYNSTTLIDCNTRKYHGQLVPPLPEIGDDNYVLLSSLNETVIQHGAEFNLGIQQFKGNNFSPNGHKYIRQFDCDVISRTIYRVGGVVLAKERLLVSFEPRVLIKYTLLEAHSPTTIRFKPFLAFRSVNELTRQNDTANTNYEESCNGISAQMYPNFPKLHMQFSKKNDYHHHPDWYKDIEYYKEKERGFDCHEDLFVPGYFEMPIKKGEEIIFSAGISETPVKNLKKLWNKEIERRTERKDMFHCLKNSAEQFYKREGDKCYLLAGYPWFKAYAREQFMALPGCTLAIDRMDYWEAIVDKTTLTEIQQFINGTSASNLVLREMDAPDALLNFIWAIQKYAEKVSIEDAANKYGELILSIISFIKQQKHPELFFHNNGLLFVNGTEKPATWMNAVEDGRPITPRTGYVVEINSLWYNALKFSAELARALNKEHAAGLLDYQAEISRESFIRNFWNGTYLYDYTIDDYKDCEVRPNMILAVALKHSPLDKSQQKAVVDMCTKELLTPKGLRSLSPKSGGYRPEYIGGIKERNRNYHNGPAWMYLLCPYALSYLKVYKNSGYSFVERILANIEVEMSELCVGTLSELYDGNPPFKGHGGMSYARNVGQILLLMKVLEEHKL